MGVNKSRPYLGPNLKKESNCGETSQIRYASCSMQGWRSEMEDSLLIRTDLPDGNQIFGVFDGHGGNQASEFVSRYFVQLLLRNENYLKKQYERALTETFLELDQALQTPNAQREMGGQKRMISSKNLIEQCQYFPTYGTTVLISLVTQDRIYMASAGDSRTAINLGGFNIRMLTEDHKPTVQKERERIEEAGFHIANERINGCLALSRAVGDYYFKSNPLLPKDSQAVIADPDIQIVDRSDIRQNSFILMACDGVWECKSNQILMTCLERYINEEEDPQPEHLSDILENMFDRLISKTGGDSPMSMCNQSVLGQDNMSAILIVFK